MIRQAISCDICGSEKQQTNHWFVAYEHNGELRLTGWASPKTHRANMKHLCGQKCVHRLLDEFMASHPAVSAPPIALQVSDEEEAAYLVSAPIATPLAASSLPASPRMGSTLAASTLGGSTLGASSRVASNAAHPPVVQTKPVAPANVSPVNLASVMQHRWHR